MRVADLKGRVRVIWSDEFTQQVDAIQRSLSCVLPVQPLRLDIPGRYFVAEFLVNQRFVAIWYEPGDDYLYTLVRLACDATREPLKKAVGALVRRHGEELVRQKREEFRRIASPDLTLTFNRIASDLYVFATLSGT